MRPRTSRGSALRRRISIRREESHLRLARSTVALLQSGGNSRLQVPAQSTFAQRCCQVLALPEVTCSYETIVFAVAIVFNDILFINASEIYSMGMRLIYMGVRWATNNGWIINARCAFMRIWSSKFVRKMQTFLLGSIVCRRDAFPLFVFVIRYLFW